MRPQDFVGYRPHQIARILRRERGVPRPWAPGERKPQQAPGHPQDSSLFPGGNVRELWNLPQFPPPLRDAADRLAPFPLTPTEAIEPAEQAVQTPIKIDDSALDQVTDPIEQPASEPEPVSTEAFEPIPEPTTEPEQIPETAQSAQPAPEASPAALVIAPAAASKTKSPRRPRRKSPDRPARPRRGSVSLRHHKAHCTICRHPERSSIEEAFFHWQRPAAIAHDFQLGDRRLIYRHARALGLYRERAASSRRSLEFVIEQAENVTATADSLIRAVRAHSCLGEDGRWREPVRESIVTYRFVNLSEALDGSVAAQKSAGKQPEISRHTCRDISAVNPVPSTKMPKFLGTIFDAWFNKNARLSAPESLPLLEAPNRPAP